jgi:hypothetical protein
MADKETTVWQELRKPFPKEVMGLLPKVSCYNCAQAGKQARSAFDKHCDKHKMIKCGDCGAYITEGHIHLDFVGHAAITDRLNAACGPENWELIPLGFDEQGNPKLDSQGQLWCSLTIFGARKLCVGDGATSGKELIGDALRNGAMRFGVALDLWTKEELESTLDQPELKSHKPTAEKPAPEPAPAPKATAINPDKPASAASKAAIWGKLKAKGIVRENVAGVLAAQYGVDPKNLTQEMADFVISELEGES